MGSVLAYLYLCHYASVTLALVDQETLTAQLAEKTADLQKWREERDQLVTALEVQMKALLSSIEHKEEEVQQLKRAAAESTGPVSAPHFLYLPFEHRLLPNYFPTAVTQDIRKEAKA